MVSTSIRREDIFQAAAQIFREKGYHAASMQDIADAVQLQKASLYHHVEGKQDILLGILDQALDLLIEQVGAVIQTEGAPSARLHRAIHVYLHHLTQHTDLAAVLLLEHRSLSPERRMEHIVRRDRFEALWRGLIEEGIEAGEFRSTDASIAVFALMGVLNWSITWFSDDGRLTPAQLADEFSDLILRGLRMPEDGG